MIRSDRAHEPTSSALMMVYDAPLPRRTLFLRTYVGRYEVWTLSDSERDSGDEVAAEAVLQPIQNFFPAVADDFA